MSPTVLVGTDGSATAASAARRAAVFADALRGELHIVTAFGRRDTERAGPAGEVFVHDNEPGALETANRQARRLRDEFPGLDIAIHAAQGRPADVLLAFAEDLRADLIVVGNKRVQGAARVLGSIAADVVRKAPCDVTIAHTHDR